MLAQGGTLAIWPEGGIRADLMAQSARGEEVHAPLWESSRLPAALLPPKSGVGFLAARTPTRVLPLAFLGTEHTLNNLRRWRRTPVTLIIGAPFGPLQLPPGVHGAQRRAALDALSQDLMRAIAALMPRALPWPVRRRLICFKAQFSPNCGPFSVVSHFSGRKRTNVACLVDKR